MENRLGGRCFMCGKKGKLEIHHIKPIIGKRPEGQMARLTEWKKNPNNLMLLCRSCHIKIHTKLS